MDLTDSHLRAWTRTQNNNNKGNQERYNVIYDNMQFQTYLHNGKRKLALDRGKKKNSLFAW